MIPTPGAVDSVRRLSEDGHIVIFTTYRNAGDPVYGEKPTKTALALLGVPYREILWSIPSPRIRGERRRRICHPASDERSTFSSHSMRKY
jgi:hypothetical protein